MNPATPSGTRCRIGRPAATRLLMPVEDTPISGMRTTSARSSPPSRSIAASASSSAVPGRAALPTRASCSTRSGSRQLSSPAATSAPIRKTNSSPGRASLINSRVRKLNDGPSRAVSTPEAENAGSVAAASRAISCLTSRPGSGSMRLYGDSPTGTSTTSSSPSWNAASWASTRCPMCGGLNAPPRTPTAAIPSTPDLPVALDDVLERGQLAKPDRPARVKLLGRVPDLGPHPELEPVGESRRRVHVDDGRIDSVRELPGRVAGRGHDRLRMPRSVLIHVCDRVGERIHDPHRHPHVEVLGVPILRGSLANGGITRRRAGALVAHELHTGLSEISENARQKQIGHRRVNEQRLRRVAHPGAVHLRVEGHPPRHLEVRVRVDVHMA